MARIKNRPRKPNATGRTDKSARFTMLPHRVLESAAYASCDLVARSVLLELVTLYNSSNNGSLYMSVRDATNRLGLADFRPVQRAFDHLQDCRLIEMAKDAHFKIKSAEHSRSRCWRISWLSWPECPTKSRRVPCWDFEQYQPSGGQLAKRAHRRFDALNKYRKEIAAGHLPVVDSTTTATNMGQIQAKPVVDSSTVKLKKVAKPPFLVVGDSTAHIDNTMGKGEATCWEERPRGDSEGSVRQYIWASPKLAA